MVCLMGIESVFFRGQTSLTLGDLFLSYLFGDSVLADTVLAKKYQKVSPFQVVQKLESLCFCITSLYVQYLYIPI